MSVPDIIVLLFLVTATLQNVYGQYYTPLLSGTQNYSQRLVTNPLHAAVNHNHPLTCSQCPRTNETSFWNTLQLGNRTDTRSSTRVTPVPTGQGNHSRTVYFYPPQCPWPEDQNSSFWWGQVRYSSFSEACQRSPSLNSNCRRECAAFSTCPRVFAYPLPGTQNSSFWWGGVRYRSFNEACQRSPSLRDRCHRECVTALNSDLARMRMEQEEREKQEAREMMQRMLRRSRIFMMTGLTVQLTSLMVGTISMIVAVIRFILSFTSMGRTS